MTRAPSKRLRAAVAHPVRRASCGLLVAILLASGCGGLEHRSGATFAKPGFAIDSNGLVRVRSAGNSTTLFVPWGYNYDWTRIDGRMQTIEEAVEQHPERVDADFAAMRTLGANTVRIFVATDWILRSPTEVDEYAVDRFVWLLDTAEAHNLRLLVTGLANLRRDDLPDWLAEADDRTLRRTERTFWSTVARVGRGRRGIFAYDIQNEPALPEEDGAPLVDGCFDTERGSLCYVHHPMREVDALRRRWYLEDSTKTDDATRFAAVTLERWASDLIHWIRREDDTHLVTVGALFPTVVSPEVDFYSVHLYPQGDVETDDWLERSRHAWREALASLPGDKPIVVEESYPFVPGFDGILPVGSVVEALLETTAPFASGWLSFYWFDPYGIESHGRDTHWLAVYRALQEVWSRNAASASRGPILQK